jgi:hypothetical protein
MAYDPSLHSVMLFGGSTASTPYLKRDTWLWDGAAWTQVPLDSPSPRSSVGMAYDASRHTTVLFGGTDGTSIGPQIGAAETWEYDGQSWTLRPFVGPGDPVPGTYDHGMVFDSARSLSVTFGGYFNSSQSDETKEWDGTRWTFRGRDVSQRSSFGLAYDSARAVSVLFGGFVQSPLGDLADTWEWNGTAWTQRLVTGPQSRSGLAMAYDPNRHVTVLFGGSHQATNSLLADTWEWDGLSWTQRPVAGPSARARHRMVYDSRRHVIVLFGGIGAAGLDGDTWDWDGQSWTQQQIAGPSPRAAHGMSFDDQRGVTVLFGGTDAAPTPTSYSDVWELRPACTPPSIATQPSSQTSCSSPVSFTVTALGTPTLTYQWRKDTQPIPGATSPTLSLQAPTSLDAGLYDCIVQNPCGAATTSQARLTVNSADFNNDGDSGTDADIDAFFACLAGACCASCGSADFNNDGDSGTDQDIESFFRVLAGGPC